MEAEPQILRQRLREAGLSNPLIDAAWPAWWSEEAISSQSAKAELRFSIARKLGLSPRSLFHDEVEFIWKDDARFKHLSNETDNERAALTSFGMSVCRMLVQAVRTEPVYRMVRASELRSSILQSRPFIDLQALLAASWAIGLPVIHLRVFPLDSKRMHAMAVRAGVRHAILLGRDAQFPASIAFTLAHEIGHVMLGHVGTSSAVVDLEDSQGMPRGDQEEDEADSFALELLIGTSKPDIRVSVHNFNARQLAQSVLQFGPELGIEPGTLALCLAYSTNEWSVANAAMQYIYSRRMPVWQEVNRIALRELDLAAIPTDTAEFLTRILGTENGRFDSG